MRRTIITKSVAPGIVYCPKYLAADIKHYRQGVRDQLLDLIRGLESEVIRAAGDYLPLRVPKRDSGMRDYLGPLLRATNQYRFTVRHWEGRRVAAHIPFWSYSPDASGIDELFSDHGLDYWSQPAAGEGQLDVFERFTELVQHTRELRGRGGIYGMITNGLDPAVISLLAEDPLTAVLLAGTIEEAAAIVVKQLASLPGTYQDVEMSEDVRQARQQDFFNLMAFEAPEEDFVSLLWPEDQELLVFSRVIVDDLRRLVGDKLGICENFDLPDQLAEVIPLRKNCWPLVTVA